MTEKTLEQIIKHSITINTHVDLADNICVKVEPDLDAINKAINKHIEREVDSKIKKITNCCNDFVSEIRTLTK